MWLFKFKLIQTNNYLLPYECYLHYKCLMATQGW